MLLSLSTLVRASPTIRWPFETGRPTLRTPLGASPPITRTLGMVRRFSTQRLPAGLNRRPLAREYLYEPAVTLRGFAHLTPIYDSTNVTG